MLLHRTQIQIIDQKMYKIYRFFIRFVVFALTMYLLPLSDYVASWFGDIASGAHAAGIKCKVSEMCDGLVNAYKDPIKKEDIGGDIDPGTIITCDYGNDQFQDTMCASEGKGMAVTAFYLGKSAASCTENAMCKVNLFGTRYADTQAGWSNMSSDFTICN